MDVLGDIDAVDGDDGAVLGNAAPALAQGAHRADRHIVRDGEDGGEVRRTLQPLAHGAAAAFHGEIVRADDVLLLGRDAQLAQRAGVAGVAQLGDGAVVGVGGQRRDAAVALFGQLHDRAVGLLLVGDGDGGILARIERAVGVGVGAADKGHVEQRQLCGRVIRASAEKNEALQALFALHHRAALHLVVAGGDLTHDHRVARKVELMLDGADDIGVEGVLHAAHHKADGVGLRAHKAARGIVGQIVVLGNDLQHAAAAFLAHVGAVVEYTGDRAHAHAAELCNVLDGHSDTLCMKKSKPVSGNLTGNVSTFLLL